MALCLCWVLFSLAGEIGSGIICILKKEAIWSWKEEKQKLKTSSSRLSCLEVSGRGYPGWILSSLMIPASQGIPLKSQANNLQVTGEGGVSCSGPVNCWYLQACSSWLVSLATSKMSSWCCIFLQRQMAGKVLTLSKPALVLTRCTKPSFSFTVVCMCASIHAQRVLLSPSFIWLLHCIIPVLPPSCFSFQSLEANSTSGVSLK